METSSSPMIMIIDTGSFAFLADIAEVPVLYFDGSKSSGVSFAKMTPQ